MTADRLRPFDQSEADKRMARRLEVAQRMADALKDGAEWIEMFSTCAADDDAAARLRAALREWEATR